MKSTNGKHLVLFYCENDHLNSAAATKAMAAFIDGNRVVTRNPAFYDFADKDGVLIGDVEKFGARNQRPDVVVIRKGSPNAEVIERSYKRAHIEVEFVEFERETPKGTVEPSAGGDVAQLLTGIMRGLADSDQKAAQAAIESGKGAKTEGKK